MEKMGEKMFLQHNNISMKSTCNHWLSKLVTTCWFFYKSISTHTPYLGFYECLHIQHRMLINSPSPPINLKKTKYTIWSRKPFKCHHKTLCHLTNQKWLFSFANSFWDQGTISRFTIPCHLSGVLQLKYCLEVIIIPTFAKDLMTRTQGGEKISS